MKIVCVCQGGNSRSVACAYLLKYKYKTDALACGWQGNRRNTLDMLYEWADKIVLMQHEFDCRIPEEFRRKVEFVDVGPDVWCNGLHPDLLQKCDTILQKSLWFRTALERGECMVAA